MPSWRWYTKDWVPWENMKSFIVHPHLYLWLKSTQLRVRLTECRIKGPVWVEIEAIRKLIVRMKSFKLTKNIEIDHPLTTINPSKYSIKHLTFLKIKKQIHKKKEDPYLHKETARKMISLQKLIVRRRFTSNGHSM